MKGGRGKFKRRCFSGSVFRRGGGQRCKWERGPRGRRGFLTRRRRGAEGSDGCPNPE
jgi:hypothetical protein